nr:hypothetical protein NG677_20085 [Methylobacterium sp. OTU13CASTA1]
MLKPNYGQAVIFPVPDEMDPAVARVLFSSVHGFSQIGISQTAISLIVNYSHDDWQLDANRREEYLSERISQLYALVDSLGEVPILFAGIINSYSIKVDCADESILSALQGEFLCDGDPDLLDLIVKFTHKFDQRFFSNTMIQNYREWGGEPPNEGIRVPYGTAVSRGVTVTHDFNDRLAFNEEPRYFSEQAVGREILSASNAALEPTLNRIMRAFDAV